MTSDQSIIVNGLIYTHISLKKTSVLTKEILKAYKPLDVYNYVLCGHVHGLVLLQGVEQIYNSGYINNKFIVLLIRSV